MSSVDSRLRSENLPGDDPLDLKSLAGRTGKELLSFFLAKG